MESNTSELNILNHFEPFCVMLCYVDRPTPTDVIVDAQTAEADPEARDILHRVRIKKVPLIVSQ